jgi:large subunit ribosomal protein L30
MSGKIKITQLKSGIGRRIDQKQTLQALGLKRIRHTVEHTATPQILGMVKKVQHLIQVQEI